MSTTISIMHISDLHRSRGSEITNDALLSSLLNDYDSYTQSENPLIKPPDLIIVSGDIIRGSVHPHNSQAEVNSQYDEALDFLNRLSKHFLNDEKSKIIVIPGNHDVNWLFSRESMKKMDGAQVFDAGNSVKAQILKDAINHHSNIRWSWKDTSFYEISDYSKYNKRFEAFSNFYQTFYEGKRRYSLDPAQQFDIFDFPDYSLTIAAFNSCYCNDHLRLAGDIHPDCIANANLQLREYKKRGRLIFATWHHNTKGLPYDFNYMDASKLKNFINSGISLGFHGHQHKTELIHEYSDVLSQRKIIVFSAGTLCGGPNELPVGTNRQYNMIEVKLDDSNTVNITLHVREKTDSSSLDNPIWIAGRIDSQLVSYHTVNIEKPKGPEIESILVEIEKLMKSGRFDEAKTELLQLPLDVPFVRFFLLDCIISTNDTELAFNLFLPPHDEREYVTVMTYAIQNNDKKRMRECLQFSKKGDIISTSVRELTKKIEALLL